ncbi:MAG: THUMP-like domain-containing protein [Bacteroidota bacterium]
MESSIDADPDELALHFRKKYPHLPAPAIATQVKLRQKAQKKLPSFDAAGCLLHPVAFEQATAEALWPHKPYGEGALAIDIGFGCAADTLALAHRYERVIAIEKSEVLLELARFNFERLGVTNVRLVQADAQEWLQSNRDLCPDLVYIDPARRDANNAKLVALDALSPNVLELASTFAKRQTRVLIKLSPLFQPTELPRQLSGVQRVSVISQRGEVKEVLGDWRPGSHEQVVDYEAIAVGADAASRLVGAYQEPKLTDAVQLGAGQLLYQADPAVQLAGQLAHPTFQSVQWVNRLGLGLVSEINNGWPGRWFRVQAVWPFSPRQLKRELKSLGISRAECLPIGFPGTGQQLAKKLGLKLGGEARLLFIELPDGVKQVVLAEQF